MTQASRRPWKERYQKALRRSNIAFALAAFLLPVALLFIVFILEKTGICVPPSQTAPLAGCSIFGIEFGDALTELLLPTALGIVTLGLMVMSGVGTFIYLMWKVVEK